MTLKFISTEFQEEFKGKITNINFVPFYITATIFNQYGNTTTSITIIRSTVEIRYRVISIYNILHLMFEHGSLSED